MSRSSLLPASSSFRGTRPAAFLPAIGLSLLAAMPGPEALKGALLLAFPLYLIAALSGHGFALGELLTRALHGRYWQLLLLPLALAAALVWPVRQLAPGGDGGLMPVLALGVVLGLALVLLWRQSIALALFADAHPLPEAERRQALAEGVAQGGAGWIAAACILLLCLSTLLAAWPVSWPATWPVSWVASWTSPWPGPFAQRLGIGCHALLAPLLAWGAAVAARRQLQRALVPEPPGAVEAAPLPPEPPAFAHPLPGAAETDAALYQAARCGRVDEALALLDRGANPHALPAPGARDQRSLPVLAAVLGDLRLLRELIGRGVDLNQAHGGLSPLLAAVRDSYHGRPDAVMMLLANGADPCPCDAEGQTALHAAARAADPAIAALLLDAGAALEALDAQGLSPLGVAAALGTPEVAGYLIERRAALEPKGGEPVLLLAAAREDGDPALLRLLLRHKARINARGRQGRTALHAACSKRNAEIVETLLKAGAAPDLIDEQGRTALMQAARAGASECVAHLAAHAADPSIRDLHGHNALALACLAPECDTATIKALLAAGVDPRQPALDGRCPLDHAVAAGRWLQVALLDPGYALPASLSDDDEVLQDAPLPVRLRIALDRESWAQARRLLPLALPEPEARAALLLERAAGLSRAAAQVLSDGLAPQLRVQGKALTWQLLALGPAAATALRVWLERGASPAGRGGLARFLEAASSAPETVTPEAEDMALYLLQSGADAFAADHAEAPLLLALRLGWRRLLEALLASGVDPDTRSAQGATALLLACEMNDEEAVKRLIVHGAQPSARTPDGQTAHGLALALGRARLSRWMDWPHWPLPRRALRDADLAAAAQQGDEIAVARLLDLGLALNATDAQGCTALLRACGGGHAALVRKLLARGADARIPAHSGATCLSVALTAGQGEVMRTLLQRGVAVDQRLPGGITPLMIAAALGQQESIADLLAHDADASATDSHDGGVLHALAQYGFGSRDLQTERAWEALLAAGADADGCNGVGETPLLLLLGASFEPGTACHEDAIMPQLEVLLRHGVRLDARERRGFGPLHLAALHGLGRVVRRLIAAGADPDLRDALNRRPAEIALMRGFVDIAAECDSRRNPAPSMARFLREPGH